MAHRLGLVVLAFSALFAASAHAGYAQLSSPAGFGGSPAGWTFAPSANDSTFGKVVHQPNALKVPVPGTAATMPASYRLAANAPRIAAAVIFNHPALRLGLGIAAWLITGKLVWDSAEQIWRQTQDPQQTTGLEWFNGYDQWMSSPSSACQSNAGKRTALDGDGMYTWTFRSATAGGLCRQSFKRTGDTTSTNIEFNLTSRPTEAQACPTGWTHSPAGCLSPALDQPTFVEKLSPAAAPNANPMPDTVPKELPPGTPLPVEQPVINPAPGPDPQPRPLFVPTGDPVPNPNYDPNAPLSPANQPWKQPGVRVVPSPTLNEPWRVDIQPTDRLVPGPEPAPEPIPEGEPNPSDKPKPEEQQSLCEKHPDVVACAKTGTVEAVPVVNEQKQLSINKDTGYGPESGTCPAPKTATVMGRPLAFKYDLLCDFAGYIKPIVIAFAWLSAALTFFGFSRKDS